jgi:hypothetical protein
MAPRQDKPDVKEAGPGWLGFGKVLLLLLFAVLLLWLGESMVQHRFFRGGAQDYRLSTGR